MNENSTNTEIYVGGKIEHASERKFIASALSWLCDQGLHAVVLANIEIDGRQIDCIVATNNFVSVVEIKASQLPLRGDLNGAWARLSASGEWTDYTNAYQQAVGAKNRVRDAMQAIKPVGSFHPDGLVVFTSPLPEGSEVTPGNFKARVTTIDEFPKQLRLTGTSPWTVADWRAFARKFELTAVTLAEVTGSAEMQETSELLRRYRDAMVSEYGPAGRQWLPETESQRDGLLEAIVANAGCYIHGPSGCGKSLMAKWLVSKLAGQGHPVFFLAAKNFVGSWADSLRREVGLLVDDLPSNLYRAVARSDHPVFLVIDGINEFGTLMTEAIRGVRALARRMGALLIVTGQDTRPVELNGLRSIEVARPTLDLKQRIAMSSGGRLSPVALDVLRGLGSGIEARLVGQIGTDLTADATRLLLIDQYIRKRLGQDARAGLFGLRRLAGMLHERVAFSVAEASFDELMHAEGLSFAQCDALFTAGILIRRAGRVSFSHEMLLNACVAWSVARTAGEDATGLGERLSLPLLDPLAGDIIAAIDDSAVCHAVLSAATSSSLLVDAAKGYFGPIAASVAMALLNETTEACVAEIRGACLRLWKDEEIVQIGWEAWCRRDWTSAERARLRAIGRRAVLGPGIEIFFRLCAEMDNRLASERRRWIEFARQEKYPLRSQSFSLVYYGFGESIGFSQVAGSTQRGFDPISKEEIAYQPRLEELTSGQLHFFLQGRRHFFDREDECLAEHLIYLFRERFRWEPYHVQLVMLDSVGYARLASQEIKDRLVEAISAIEVSPGNWAISSSIVDALKILGALDEGAEESRAEIRAEIASALVDDGRSVDGDLALALCAKMFDHPYDFIYAEEIDDLDEAMRRRLYRLAIQAPSVRRSMSLNWLVEQLASLGDPMDVALLQPLTGLPSRINPFPQEEWGAFAAATRVLGRHHGELEPVEAATVEERCLVEIRSLIYLAESGRDAGEAAVRHAWRRLGELRPQLVVGCLSEIQRALHERPYRRDGVESYPPMDLVAVYTDECLAVARRFIDDGALAEFYHQVPDHERGVSFAFAVVGRYGDRSDLERLRARSRAHHFARHALAALRRLDGAENAGRNV
ncbi:NERD domain-containing protein [Burkholderia pseudomallei]|uniref:NERD domain-containing protein n=1 Tax=Burkholderia pseudomallei TaxID=28450 RepID=UPI00105DB070|nr:NERD domain-containing protein [Burkholderia pseudomallei]